MLAAIAALVGAIAPTIAQALLGGGSWGTKAILALQGLLGATANGSLTELYLRLQGMKEDERVTLARLDEEFKVALINAELELGKATIAENVIEEASDEVFQKNWRPLLAWICDIAVGVYFLIGFLILPILALMTLAGLDPAKVQVVKATMPVFDIANLMVLLGYLLGYGGLQALTNSSSTVQAAEQAADVIKTKVVPVVKKHWYDFLTGNRKR